jgi:hypothetical protein
MFYIEAMFIILCRWCHEANDIRMGGVKQDEIHARTSVMNI